MRQQNVKTFNKKGCGDGVKVACGWSGIENYFLHSFFRHSPEASERDAAKATVGNCIGIQRLTIEITSDVLNFVLKKLKKTAGKFQNRVDGGEKRRFVFAKEFVADAE
jgi:hypothetical protein